MRRVAHVATLAAGLLAGGTAAHAQYDAYGLATATGGAQQLVRFNTSNPTAVTTVGVTGTTLTGIDFRPATGQLFGFNGTGVYVVDLNTGAASLVGSGIGATVSGNVAFDFNPTVDRIRLVGPSGTNLRLNPITGGVAATDGAYTYAPGDPRAGATPVFSAAAYTNSVPGTVTSTTLYGIDANFTSLVLISSPNGGSVSTVGSLGAALTGTVTGFDIVTVGTTNLAYVVTSGAGAANALYTVDLGTGAATRMGSIGPANATIGLQGLAIATVPEPGTWAMLAAGLTGLGAVARRRRRPAA